MKKSALIIAALTIAVFTALTFTGCGRLKAENKLLEAGEFIGDTGGKYDDQITLSMKSDKTYILNDYSYEEEAIVTYEGKWSYVLTYKYKSSHTIDVFELIKITDRHTFYIFKLDGCTNESGQGYFVYTGYTGKIYYTDEEINKSHFDNQQNANGSIELSGTSMRKNFDKIN